MKEFTILPDRKSNTVMIDLKSEINEWKVMYWGPGNPNLYDVTFKLYEDEVLIDMVQSYFGM